MKKLQNNFTTLEQSKRLLELGVSTNSADFALVFNEKGEIQDLRYLNLPYSVFVPDGYEKYYSPCWTVGRLQEIFAICYKGEPFQMWCNSGFYLIDNIIEGMELRINEMDFSKLED